MTTSIDKIREQVERVREDHRSDNHPQLPYCSCDPGTKDGSLIPWPCPTLRFAEKMLKLAEALEQSQLALDHLWAAIGDRLLAKGPLSKEYANSTSTRVRQASESAERILAECAEEK